MEEYRTGRERVRQDGDMRWRRVARDGARWERKGQKDQVKNGAGNGGLSAQFSRVKLSIQYLIKSDAVMDRKNF